MRRTEIVVVLLLVGSVFVFPKDTADAFPTTNAFAYECGPHIDADFNGTWSQTVEDEAKSALNEFEGIRSFDGSKKVHFKWNPDPGWADDVVAISWEDLGLIDGDSFCVGYLGDSWIHLNNHFNDPDLLGELHDLVRHEMGHILGPTHTGLYDSFGSANEQPTMADCEFGADDRVLGQDDSAAIQYHVGTGSHPPVSADIGFEEATSPVFWGKTGGSYSVLSGGSAYEGDQYLTWTPGTINDYLYQTINLTHKPTEADETIDVKLHARKSTSLGSGNIWVYLYRRDVEYGEGTQTCPGSLWPTNRNQNDRSYPNGSGFILITGSYGYFSPGTGWTGFDTPDVDVSLDFTCDPDCVHAWDVRMLIYSTVVLSGGTPVAVHLDSTRMRGGL